MKTKAIAFLAIAAVVMSVAAMGSVMAEKKDKCTTIQDGSLTDVKGNLLTMGYDQWSYNYQAHIFDGWYHNAPRPDPPYTKDTIDQAPSKTWLEMKWNDAWLSNKDCDGDNKLDRHYGYDSYIGSGAWCTNHQSGTYVNDDGETCNWNYFVKIVAVPEDAVATEGIWYTADGKEIGPSIWGQFAIIQQVYNDPCAGDHGIEYLSPAAPGLGCY